MQSHWKEVFSRVFLDASQLYCALHNLSSWATVFFCTKCVCVCFFLQGVLYDLDKVSRWRGGFTLPVTPCLVCWGNLWCGKQLKGWKKNGWRQKKSKREDRSGELKGWRDKPGKKEESWGIVDETGGRTARVEQLWNSWERIKYIHIKKWIFLSAYN